MLVMTKDAGTAYRKISTAVCSVEVIRDESQAECGISTDYRHTMPG